MPEPSQCEVSLDAILAARDARAQRQRALLSSGGGRPLLCLLVNMPGPIKRTLESDRVFYAGLAACREALANADIPILFEEAQYPATGCEAYLVPDADAETVKRIACTLESTLPYGRLLDIDIHAQNGAQLSRTALGFSARGCMVCGREGAYCASRRIHTVPELIAAFNRLAATAPEERP